MIYDLHTHTVFSHGKGSPQDNVEAAIEKGLAKIAIADHAMGHVSYGIRNVEKYLSEIERLKDVYAGRIEVLSGIECNLLGEQGQTEMNDSLRKRFDVCLLGYHKFIATKGLSYTAYCYLTKRRDYERNTRAIINAMKTGYFDILAHPGYGMAVDISAIAAVCRDTNTLFEINRKHTEMSAELLKIAAAEGARFILSSDAHETKYVGQAGNAERLAAEAGIENLVVNI